MKKIIIILVISFLRVNPAIGEKVPIDNLKLQKYNGSFGIWVSIKSKKSLISLSKKFMVPLSDIYRINRKTRINRLIGNYTFLPYSQEYLKQLKEADIKRTIIDSYSDEFIWPIAEMVRITSVLGLRNGRFHPGLDIPAVQGTPVLASMEGRVIFSGYSQGYGRCLLLEHRNNFVTRYSHHSANLVKKGDYVNKGQIIAFVGSTGNSTGNHLHFEIRCNNIPLDPIDFLAENTKLHIVHTLKNWK